MDNKNKDMPGDRMAMDESLFKSKKTEQKKEKPNPPKPPPPRKTQGAIRLGYLSKRPLGALYSSIITSLSKSR
jgi:hypothetical protein